MRFSLYKKIFFWLLLNIVFLCLLGLGFIGIVLLGASDGLLPPYLFSRSIENQFRSISANLQYKPTAQWEYILRHCTQNSRLRFTLHSMDGNIETGNTQPIPKKVLRTASRIPRLPFTLCPDPSFPPPGLADADADDLPSSPPMFLAKSMLGMEAGIPSSPPVIFMRAGEPSRHWLGRVLFVPDSQETLHYMLLAVSSESITGYGEFFELNALFVVLVVVLGLSCLWWWPFVRHMSKPLLQMVAVAERLAADDRSLTPEITPGTNICGVKPGRRDEIGRLSEALTTMAQQVRSLLLGQRRFIRHIAHEVNSPLARINLGLAVLGDRLEGEAKTRVDQISADVERLSSLTGDILSYLRAEAAPLPPKNERINIGMLLRLIVRMEAPDGEVRSIAPPNLDIWGDKEYVRRAVSNVLGNALKYAREYGPVVIEAREQGAEVVIEVRDQGPGVQTDDLPFILEPFFRGHGATRQPGAGLGLSIVKHCVEACGGAIQYENGDPAGFVVRMRFAKA